MKENYIEKIYAGVLGKLIGIRYGAPIESWTYDEIKKIYGKLDNYIVDYEEFAADDDSNGPVFFIRALTDYTHTRDITPEEIGLTWLNYASNGHGFYWWGGFGVSTEHTAYTNLKNGIMAPKSGSIEQNGYAIAEQIGGQIFIDSWGLVTPNNPSLAAEYAMKAASVSHDGNGIYGGVFIAACISAAFEENDIIKIIERGLKEIPDDCEYYTMTNDIIRFYNENPKDWEVCYKYIFENYGYDKYPGLCHIIPNSAVIILSLLYGEGDFTKTINICNMCGWDTDCNVANVGTILGVMNGLDGIDDKWRSPIKDKIVCSSVMGSLNIVDIPDFVAYLSDLAYKIANTIPTGKYKSFIKKALPKYSFILPGSIHGFKVKSKKKFGTSEPFIKNVEDILAINGKCLKVVCKPISVGETYKVYQQTYYKPEDLHDNRYDPVFSPIIYPGQTVKASVRGDEFDSNVIAKLYCHDRNNDEITYGEKIVLCPNEYKELTLNIPSGIAGCIDEVGVEILSSTNSHKACSNIFIEWMNFEGKANYILDFKKETMEIWDVFHREVSQCTRLKGHWTLDENKKLMGVTADETELFTGNYYWTDYEVSTLMTPIVGNGDCLNFRVQGAIKSYAVGLFDDKLILKKNNNGYVSLAEVNFEWNTKSSYLIKADIVDNIIKIYVNDKLMIEYTDIDKPYLFGSVGVSILDKGQCKWDWIKVKEY